MLFRTEYAGGKRGRMDILTWVTAVRRHLEAEAGLGRIVALCYCSSTSYQIH